MFLNNMWPLDEIWNMMKYAAREIWRAPPISTDWLLAECAVSNAR